MMITYWNNISHYDGFIGNSSYPKASRHLSRQKQLEPLHFHDRWCTFTTTYRAKKS
jgi:hypothetical protein